MRITKAVIPAAGLGTRFLPATKAMPKEMLPVVDKPAIQYVVEEAVAAGLNDVLMITGRNKNALENHFDRMTELEATLEEKGDVVRLKKVEYTNADDTLAGILSINSVFSKKAMEFTRSGGAEWTVVKSGRLKQFYSVLENDVPIAKMDLQTLALKRTYPLDIAESVDLPLAMGLVWAINFAHLRRVSGAGAAAG